MKLKYRNKVYSSDDVPLFLYFKNFVNKKNFANTLTNYNVGAYTEFSSLHGVLAGNTSIKDKRSKIYFCIESNEEKNLLVKGVFEDKNTDNNAMVCSPPDITEDVLINWIEKNIEKIK